MDWQLLDYYFPWFLLAYGLLITVTLQLPPLQKLAKDVLPTQIQAQLRAHELLAIFSLVVGGLWCLQQTWFNQLDSLARLY